MATAKISLGGVMGGPPAKIELNGHDITSGVQAITLHAKYSDLTTLEITYACSQGAEFEGVVIPYHVCPIAEST